jgi:carbonic anhydrase
MPACCITLRPVAAALFALSVGWCAAAEPASAAKAAASQSEAEPASAASAKARPRGVPDPMDMLREKLAQKLGTAKPAPGNPNDVQVTSKATAPVAAEHARVAAPVRAVHRSTAAAAPHAAGAEHGANTAHAAHATHWDYSGSGGPEAWGQLQPEFAKCSTGTRQSPIDIRDGIKVGLEAVQFNYQPGSFRVIDNGHTVQVNLGAGNSIEVMGRRYELVQFHFHRPSEERVDGRQFDMVVHLVHKDIDGRLAVVAVLLERGAAQPIIQNVWNNLPLEKGDEIAARGTLNPADLLPAERNYFTYMGSLTTPPCSEGVLWMVMKQPVQVSAEQIGIFSRLYPMNARPIQSAAGRLIKESN